MAVRNVAHPSVDDRRATGRQARERTRYADQNERDYQQFVTAIRSGRLEALEGV